MSDSLRPHELQHATLWCLRGVVVWGSCLHHLHWETRVNLRPPGNSLLSLFFLLCRRKYLPLWRLPLAPFPPSARLRPMNFPIWIWPPLSPPLLACSFFSHKYISGFPSYRMFLQPDPRWSVVSSPLHSPGSGKRREQPSLTHFYCPVFFVFFFYCTFYDIVYILFYTLIFL